MIINRGGEKTVSTVASFLLEHKTVICSCDTMYGIHGIAPESREAIIRAKGRDENKPFIVLALPEMLEELSSDRIPDFVRENWPGPLTAIVNSKKTGSFGPTIALRIPDDRFIRDVLLLTGRPLYSTSVNVSGEQALNDIESIREVFAERVDLICDSGNMGSTLPSTIIDISKQPFRLIRQGKCLISDKYLQ
jgi:L-threonylcarbamoyladenylate synthase